MKRSINFVSNGYEVETGGDTLKDKDLLKYYLASEPHFLIYVDMLLTNGFYETFIKNDISYEKLSDIAVKVSEHAQLNNGFYLNSDNSGKYFERGYSDIQLFSIIFALIIERSTEEVEIIADKTNSGISFYILRSLLCGTEISELLRCLHSCTSDTTKRIILNNTVYQGSFYIRPLSTEYEYVYPWHSYFNKSSLVKYNVEEKIKK